MPDSRRACLFAFLALAFATAHAETRSAHNGGSATLPITTRSAPARKHFDSAMQDLDYIRVAEALQEFRLSANADPKFAQAFILIAHLSSDPEEQETARVHAKQLLSGVTPGEGLLIRWLAGVQENDYVPAIAAMNDLLAQYPRDQRLAFLAGRWLMRQGRYGQSIMVLERAVTLAPDYPAAVNELGYAYAHSGNFSKAFAAMEHYTALQPDQPNPYDSYGEILRLSGKFEAALSQYRKSIQMDPNFGSELGVADTYALMGREAEAREEYARAVVFAGGQSDKVEYELQAAITWIRDDNRKQAEHALREVAKNAHRAGLARLEAEAHRVLAMYEPDYKLAIKQLQAAQESLDEGHRLSRSDLDEEHARILRVLATRSAEAHEIGAASDAVRKLEQMAQSSRIQAIQLSYHAAAGALLAAQEKYTDAIPHLEEDSNDPLSMRLLWRAYANTGAKANAGVLAERLASVNLPTVEQALVVPRFRASLVTQAQQP